MSSWTHDELDQANKEDLYISAPNADGSMHAPTWIWMIVVDGELYCRSYNGKDGRWYSAAKNAGHGRAKFGSVDKAVTFEFLDDETLDQKIDKAYKAKYAGSPYLDGPLHEPMRSTTVRLGADKRGAMMEAYNPELWREFFGMMGHGSAVLAGLVFVAIEINTTLLFKDGTHRGRAIGTIAGFMSVFAISSFGLLGHQTHVTLGLAWLIFALAGLVVYARGFFADRQSGLGTTPLRVTLGVLGYLGQVVGTLLMLAGVPAGIYIAAITMTLNMLYLVSGAWLLLLG